MDRGEAWLKAELVKSLNWDELFVEGVVDVISKAKSAEEVHDVVDDFMENNPVAITIISDYMEAKNAPKQQMHQQSAGSAMAQPVVCPSQHSAPSSYSASVTSAAKPPPAHQAIGAKHEKEKWLNLGGGQLPPSEDLLVGSSKDAKVSSKEQAEATLSMFKRGSSKVRPRGATSGAGGSSNSSKKGQQGLDAITANLERKVANCLSCGKIFDCRNVTNDIIKFVHDGFHCTFCGSTVAMTQQQRIEQAQQQQQAEAAAGNSTAADSATAQAIAFKDRLVDYDRNSQQRTTVIDNQSDYFEIDTNAWLSQEERDELRRREQLEEEAAAARKNKVFVTLDLLGRKVLVAEGPNGAAAAGGVGSGAAFQVVSATDQLRQSLPMTSSSGAGDGVMQGSRVKASSSTAGDSDKGAVGGESAQMLMGQALEALRDLRITACPTIGTPPPVFVPAKHHQQQVKARDKSSAAVTGQQQQHPKQRQKQQKKQQGQQQTSSRGDGAASGAAAADSRIQDDSIFVEFEAELLYDDLVKRQQQQQGIVRPSVHA